MNLSDPKTIAGAITVSAVLAGLITTWGVGRLVGGEPPAESAAVEGVADAGAAGSEAAPSAEAVAAEDGEGRRAGREPRVHTETEYKTLILGRNIFDMSKIGLKPTEDGGGGGGGPSSPDFKVTLRATMVADPPTFSAAFFMREGDTYAHGYGIGQEILGAKILEIERDRVKVLRNGNEEWITTGGVQEAPKPAATSGEGATTEGVEALSETEFNVTKALLDANLNNLDELSKLGRALLHRGPDGEYDGYRLSAIRRGSLAEQLGIRNGDIIHSVNGTPLNSVQGAMAAFQSLQGGTSPGSAFKFEVTRRGQPVTLSYNVK